MQRHPLLHANAYSGDFVLTACALFRPTDPDADAILAPFGTHIERGDGAYDPFFKAGNESANIRAATPEVEHHVGDSLARTVIGQLPPTSALVHREARPEEMGRICAGPRRVEWRVFQEPD